MKPSSKVLVLTGPTGVGKTRLAVTVAEKFGAEVISADSRQVYKYIDIGTAKPSLEERRRVPHHLVDFLELEQKYSAAAFARDARSKMDELESQGGRFMVVGGTGLYIKALIEGLSPIPPVDPKIRMQLKRQAKELGLRALYQRLSIIDPRTAARLSPNDRCRILRALEVFQASGRPISEWQQHPRIKDAT
jgi:tRNA dimethylallyltransferase